MPDGSCPGMPQVTVVDDQFGTHSPVTRVHASRIAARRSSSDGMRSHRITVWSQLAVAKVCPSGLNATELTESVWPVRG
jgi:hypothetical protein